MAERNSVRREASVSYCYVSLFSKKKRINYVKTDYGAVTESLTVLYLA